MNRKFYILMIVLVAMLAVAPASTIWAQSSDSGNICVDIDGQEVCGTPATIALILQATSSDSDEAEESEFFITTAPHSGLISINVPSEGVDPFKLATRRDGQTAMITGAHHMVAEPGGRTTEDCVEADADPSALCSLRTNVQQTFVTDGPSRWLLPEGSDMGVGILVFTGPTMVIELADGREIVLERGEEDHSYLVVVGGADGDGETPGDLNNRVTISEYDAGSTMVSTIPPAQFLSFDWTLQNVDAALNNECGNDGCRYVTLVAVDINGAVTVVTFSTGEAQIVASNWLEIEENE